MKSATPDDVLQRPTQPGEGLAAGIAAGALATGCMLVASIPLEGPSVPELLAEVVASVTPLELIERLIQVLGSDAKRLLFTAVLIAQVAVGGLLGLTAAGRWSGIQRVGVVCGLAAVVLLLILPAANARAAVPQTIADVVVGATVYLAAYTLGTRYLNPRGYFAVEEAAARRRFLRQAATAAAGLALGIASFRWLTQRLEPPAVAPRESRDAGLTNAALAAASSLDEVLALGVPGLSPEITPNERFYVVSKNFFRDPEINETSWRLEVGGFVQHPLTFTLEQIKALPQTAQYFTLQCISNEVGGDLMGNAHWRGVSLQEVLERAGLRAGAVDIVLHSADGYTDSIPLAKAMQKDTVLAYEMNGDVLPRNHGFPVRLLVPDIYGMKNVKWVTKIEVVEYDFKGYWMQRGWSDVATMNTTSRIDVPRNRSFLRAGPNLIGGVAVAGQRGIGQVEVSTDGGITWDVATVKAPLGPNSWSLWLYRWEAPDDAVAERKILVRATDDTGALQTSVVRETIPDGATGYHTIAVQRATT
jgi:DMSO/TMAO reductase YedYZ molybdopterin-dependent catalytic subunit